MASGGVDAIRPETKKHKVYRKMSDKPKSSLLSRIASRCALICLGAFLICAASAIMVISSPVIGTLIGLVSGLTAFASGAAGVILGIVALCRLTPEEKEEGLWQSGTTKNLAAVGIVMPPLLFAVLVFVMILIRSMV